MVFACSMAGANEPYAQWFMGSIFSPTPTTPPPGHPTLQIITTAMNAYGEYEGNWKRVNRKNIYSITTTAFAQIGFTRNVGMGIVATGTSNFANGKNYNDAQDSIFAIGYQIFRDDPKTWKPDLRILLKEILPTGNYRNLDPNFFEADSTGGGSFQTGISLAYQKKFTLSNGHNLRVRFVPGYIVPASTRVTGFHTYGGGFGTSGRVRPGNYFLTFLLVEYALSRTWVFSVEQSWLQQDTGKFRGRKGVLQNGMPASNTPQSSTQWTVLPYLEKTISSTDGFFFGGWFTPIGRNTDAFASLMLSYFKAF